METVKKDNERMMDTSPREAGFFYRRIGGTLFKVRVYTGSGYADTLDEKIPRLILNEMVTGAESYVKMDSVEMDFPKPAERPSVIVVNLTMTCNLRCKYCFAACEPGAGN